MTVEALAPVMLVVLIFPKPGRLERFLEAQLEGVRRITIEREFPGWRGNRLSRGLDGQTVVMVSMFNSLEAHRRFTQQREFAEHLERIAPMLERTEARFGAVMFAAGQV